MGLGDNLIATGMARGAAKRGNRIAFGNGTKIIWDVNSPEIFRNNPNIAPAGSEHSGNIEWIEFYKGRRKYNRLVGDRWVWNYDFQAAPGEMFFDANENIFRLGILSGFVLIEPNLPWHKSVAPNKDWGKANYQAVADQLRAEGHDVVQFSFGRDRLSCVRVIETKSFRQALAALSRAKLAVMPEGGLHHGAAAVGVPAVVLFGGFIPPEVTGYAGHTNLTGGAEACGSLKRCEHCQQAMQKISREEVLAAARERLSVRSVQDQRAAE